MQSNKLSTEQETRLREVYEKSRDNTLAHDVEYFVKLNPAVFEKLQSSSNDDARRLGKNALLMQQFIIDCEVGNYYAPTGVIHAFTAALLYLVNPFGLIPDTVAQTGYSDDLYVMEFALASHGQVLDVYVDATNRLTDK